MKKVFFALLIFCLCSCHKNLYVKKLSEQNPVAYEYPFSLDTIKATVRKEFGNFSFYGMSVVSADREIKRNANARKVFENSNNLNDFYLHNDYHPFTTSKLYLDKEGKGYPYYAEFHLHLSAVDNTHTTVQVITYESQLEYGKSLFSWHGVGRVSGSKKVPPSTIEEYQVLLRIGKRLGIVNQMPALRTPN